MANGYGAPNVGLGLSSIDGFGKNYYEENPETAYADYLSELGLNGNDNRSKFAWSQYNRYYNMFKSNLGRGVIGRAGQNDPDLYWTNYMRHFNPNKDFQELSPSGRGLSSSQPPRLRWLEPVL
jgi:hypothetical protein